MTTLKSFVSDVLRGISRADLTSTEPASQELGGLARSKGRNWFPMMITSASLVLAVSTAYLGNRLYSIPAAPSGSPTLIAGLYPIPSVASGAEDESVAIDQEGTFRSDSRFELVITSPRDGYAAILWISPQLSRVYPDASQEAFTVKAQVATRYEEPLPVPSATTHVSIVITPQDAAQAIRDLLSHEKFNENNTPRQFLESLPGKLTATGSQWVAIGQITVTPSTQP